MQALVTIMETEIVIKWNMEWKLLLYIDVYVYRYVYIGNLKLWLGAATVVPRVEVAAWDLERRIWDQRLQLAGAKS